MAARALALLGFGVMLLSTAGCGGASLFGGQPSPSPVTVESVNAAVENSTLESAHYRASGTFVYRAYRFDVTGDGVLQLAPVLAFSMNLTLPIRGAPTFHYISIRGRDYTRVNSGRWTSTPEAPTSSPAAPYVYVGEERVGGDLAWHIRSADSSRAFDEWVRESDGYYVYMSVSDPKYSLALAFDSYNQSPVITAP
jgi:hypothetical protein